MTQHGRESAASLSGGNPALSADGDAIDRLRRRAVVLCIITTTLVASAEITIGVVFRLISVTAEGLHTAADLLDSLIAYFLVIVASRPADREHPYGHGKFDSLGAIVEGGFVAVTGGWALLKSAGVLLGFVAAEPRPEAATIAVMLVVAVLYWRVSGYVIRLAQMTHSPLVFAEAMHLRSHVWITLSLAVGLGLSKAGMMAGLQGANQMDALVALVLGAYLIRLGSQIIRPGFSQLMDTALPEEEVQRISGVLERFREEFVEIHGVRTRGAGTDRHVDIHLMVEGERTVQWAHELSHRIETELRERIPGVRLLVHVEPAIGRAWEEYLARRRVGRVLVRNDAALGAEADHHSDAQAHQV